MKTNNINNIFGNISPENRPELDVTNDSLLREWEEMQVDISELENISIDAESFPTKEELAEMRSEINHTTRLNPAYEGMGIVLSIVSVVVLSVALLVINSDSGTPKVEKEKIVLAKRNSSFFESKAEQKREIKSEENFEESSISQTLENEEIKAREITDFDLIRSKELNRFMDVNVEMERRFENYLFDYNYKYMHSYKIYNYESRLAPPETISVKSKTPKLNQGWNSYRVPRDVVFSNRVYEDKLEKAFKYLKKERYIEVNLILESIIELFPLDQNAWFYLGISKYRQEDYEGAQVCFEKISEGYPAVFKPEAEWYKSLSLLNSGNIKMAKEDLQKIASRSGFYQEKAAQLLANNLKE